MLAIKEQRLKKNDIEHKIKRILDCKKRFFTEYKPIYIPTISKAFNKENQKKALEAFNTKQ